jgi:tetratricopeptide (TPR) repeat protein
VKDFFEFNPLGKLEVKGKEQSQEAYQLIKAGEIETRFKASVAKGLTIFVGRKNSMAALKEPYEKVLAGSGQVVGIVGEAGVGKSRLLYEFIKHLSLAEVNCLEGRCLHYGGSIIYMPILDILKTYFDIKEEDREFIIKKKIKEKISALNDKLVSVIPPFQDRLSLKVDDAAYLALEPKQKREKTFEALRDLFIWESQDKPLVLVIEDMHWIDKTSEEFLDYLIGCIANARIMLIFLYRPEYIHQWGNKSYYTNIGLTQLGIASRSQLVHAILEDGEVVPELRELILDRTEGNPLFMEEFTHTLLENGSIQRKDHQYVLRTEASNIQVPDTIQGIIAARMDRLEDNLKRTMQVASVIGRNFAFRILQTITGMREELKSYLLNLQGLEFIYEKRLLPELEYIFKHALTQEVAYNSLLLKRKREIHEKIGKAIEEIYAKRLEEFYEMLVYHFDQGEVWDKAFVYAVKAGMKARHGYIFQTAMDHFDRAKEILEKHELDVPWRVCYDLYFERGAAWVDSGQARYSFRELEEAANIARINERTDLRVKAMVSHAIAALYSQERDELKSILEEMEPLVTDDMESLLGVIAVQAFSCVTLAEDLPLGLTKEKEMTDLFHRAPNSPFSPHAGYWMGFFHRWRGEYQKCSGIIEPLLPEFKVLVSTAPHFYLGATCWYALALGEQGLYQDTLRILEEGREFGIKSGERYTTPKLTNSLGWAYNQLCHFDKAIEYNNLSLKSIQDLLGPGTSNLFEIESQARINLGEDYLMTGDRKKAQEHLELVYENMRNPEYNFGRTRWKPRCLLRLGELWLQAGDTDKAESFLSELIEHQWTDQFPYMKYQVLAYRLRGQILATRGQIEEAEVELHRVITLAQKLGNPTELWKTHQALGAMLLSQSKGEEAGAEFHAALEVVQGIAEGLTDAALKEGYLQSHPIKELASQAERSQRCKDRMA